MSDQVATKADIAELKAAFKGETTEIRADILILKAPIALVQWLIGGVGFGVLLLVLKSFWPN
jgi:hypothetical protein